MPRPHPSSSLKSSTPSYPKFPAGSSTSRSRGPKSTTSASARSRGFGTGSGSTSYPTSASRASYRSSTGNSRRRRTATPAPSIASGRKFRCASSIGGSENHEIICAVSESRGVTPSVGIVFVNVSTGEANLTQICDTQFYVKTLHQIIVCDPFGILLVSTSFPPNPVSTLNSMLLETYQNVPHIPLDRKYWSEQTGLEYLQTLAFRDDVEAMKVAVEGNFYATCAFSAVCRHAGKQAQPPASRLLFGLTVSQVMRYLETEFSIRFAPHSLRIKYQSPEATMMIDLRAIASLELMQNLRQAKSKDCLFGFLNRTLTPMGTRMLRANILRPDTKTADIEPRYDALEELSTNEDMYHEVRKGKIDRLCLQLAGKMLRFTALAGFDDVEKYVSDTLRIQAEAKKRDSSARKIALKRKLIFGLREALQVAHNSGMDDGALAAYLRKLQGEFIQRMEQNERPVEDDGLGDGEPDVGASQGERADVDKGVVVSASTSDSD